MLVNCKLFLWLFVKHISVALFLSLPPVVFVCMRFFSVCLLLLLIMLRLKCSNRQNQFVNQDGRAQIILHELTKRYRRQVKRSQIQTPCFKIIYYYTHINSAKRNKTKQSKGKSFKLMSQQNLVKSNTMLICLGICIQSMVCNSNVNRIDRMKMNLHAFLLLLMLLFIYYL